jgi:hypothetical protein
MRGGDERSGSLFSYVDLEAVGEGHPLRPIRLVVNEALAGLSCEFSALYANWVDRRFRLRSCCERCSCTRSNDPLGAAADGAA